MDHSPAAKTAEQADKVIELQDLLLDDFIRLAKDKLLTSTDRAVLYRMLRDNGWSLDPSKLPQKVRDLLTRQVQFDEDLESDAPPKLKVVV